MDSTPPPQVVVKTKLVAATPDESLRNCATRPARRPLTGDTAVAELIAEAFAYGDDCSSKNASTWKSIDETKKKVDDFNAAQ